MAGAIVVFSTDDTDQRLIMAKKKYHHASHSKYSLKYHFVFCCKYRKKCFNHPPVVEEIKRLCGEIAEKSGFEIDTIEMDVDHCHILVDAPPTLSPASIASRLKSQTTYHIWKTQDEYLQWLFWKERTFWSDGYFVCTTGDASTETIRQYIGRGRFYALYPDASESDYYEVLYGLYELGEEPQAVFSGEEVAGCKTCGVGS